MQKIADAAADFLGHSRVAITGVSRHPENHGANIVYQRLRDRGYEVFAVNPNADVVEGDPCYANLAAIPDGVEAVVIGTAPERSRSTVEECVELGIQHVWFHRGPGAGSADEEAAELGRRNGIAVIDGGCPCMFGPTSDVGHRIMRPLLKLTGNVPRRV